MADKFKKYKGKDADVEFSATRCIHSAKCVHGLPEVFNPDARPWINAAASSSDKIARAVFQCPSGALRLARGPRETPDAAPTASCEPDGPLYIRGDIDLAGVKETRIALCRCGGSYNKPYCDGTHSEIRFKDDGCCSAAAIKAGPPKEGALALTPQPNGPVMAKGPLTIKNSKGEPIYQEESCALCRCGQSKNRPFCDGSHVTAGFKS